MSGPIVRKYGFPNFEKIFGERDIKHGADPSQSPSDPSEPAKPEAAQGQPEPARVEPAKPDKP